MNIVYIDGNFNDGSPGPLTCRLMECFAEYTAAYRG
jgi:hypothetical protein